MRECYEAVIGQVIVLAAEKKKVPRRINNTEPHSPDNDLDIHRLSAQLTIISHDHIHSIGELEGKIESLKASYEQAVREINILTAEQERLTSLIQQAEIYYDLSGRDDLTDMEQLRLTVSRQSMLNNGISEKSDLDHLDSKLQENEKQMSLLPNSSAALWKARYCKSSISCKSLYSAFIIIYCSSKTISA